jgi:hypothetical protein
MTRRTTDVASLLRAELADVLRQRDRLLADARARIRYAEALIEGQAEGQVA